MKDLTAYQKRKLKEFASKCEVSKDLPSCELSKLPEINGKSYEVSFEQGADGEYAFHLYADRYFIAEDFKKLVKELEKKNLI